jgi:RNA polymerase sigma factor (sigma-70 family)
MNPAAGPAEFAPTRWTLVLRARGESPEARAALSDLCAAYYQPVFRFLRREGRDDDVARELAQEFFARVLQHGDLGAADPSRGRFRSYLLGAVKHFLADQRKQAGRQKRGGGAMPSSLDAPVTDEGATLDLPDTGAEVPDAWFDRQWALAVMERALVAVEAEFAGAGKAAQFEQLKPWLMGEAAAPPQAEVARRLGLNEGAVKVAIHRLRKRFRDILRAEVRQTLSEGDNVDDELRYLVAALAHG